MENINTDLAKLATTASVLVNSAANNSSINDLLQKNKTFTSTFDSQKDSNTSKIVVNQNGNQSGLISLLAKHGETLRVAKTLKRSNFTDNGKKKKDFNILSNDMLNDIHDLNIESNASGSSDISNENPPFSLFQGFTAILPEVDETINNIKAVSGKLIKDSSNNYKPKLNKTSTSTSKSNSYFNGSSKMNKIEEITTEKINSCQNQRILLNYKSDINYHLDLLEIRKGLGKNEILEIDSKIDRLFLRRKEISDNVEFYEKNEIQLENHLLEIKERLEFIKDINIPELDDTDTNDNGNNENKSNDKSNDKINVKKRNQKNKAKTKTKTPNISINGNDPDPDEYDDDYVTVYMEDDSKSYTRVTSTSRTFKSGQQIHKFQAHQESINCLAFDEPYGKLLTCSMDNTVRVWDMNRYKCIGLLEGHYSYVDCVSINNDIAFTGSMDATVKMWDLNYFDNNNRTDETPLLNSFEGHVDIVTALSYNNGELVSGSNDKTIRQWDLNTGHLVQTIDVLWASSMANSTINFVSGSNSNNSNSNNNTNNNNNNNIHNTPNSAVVNNGTIYPYISSLQVFDAALASGSNDGIVRLWDLRSGEVIRQLFGHTGAITTLQFDKNFNLITGSADRSVRIWDLRTGGLLDSFSYNNPIKKIMFDDLKIASVVENERGVHIYDRIEQNHWVLGGDILENVNENENGNGNGNGNVKAVSGSDIVNDMAFSGCYLVEGRTDGVVSVWNV